MSTQPTIGYGCTLEYESGVDTWVAIPGIRNIAPPNPTTEEVEVTSQDSPGGYRQFIPGLRDPGELEVEVNWMPDNATQIALRDLRDSGEIVNWRITYNDVSATVVQFPGYVMGIEGAIPVDDAVQATMTVRVTGPLTYPVVIP